MMKQTINKISQIKINGVKQEIDVAASLKDRAPKESSTNVITSGAVHAAIEALEQKHNADIQIANEAHEALQEAIDALPELTWDNLGNKPFEEITGAGAEIHSVSNAQGGGFSNMYMGPSLINGSKYVVSIDDIEYLCDYADYSLYFDGTKLIEFSILEDSGDSWISYFYLYIGTSDVSYDVKISEWGTTVKIIADKYIPESIARVSDVDAKIQAIPGPTWEALPDKPFYEELVVGDVVLDEQVTFNQWGEIDEEYARDVYSKLYGGKYFVVIDGEKYLCTCYSFIDNSIDGYEFYHNGSTILVVSRVEHMDGYGISSPTIRSQVVTLQIYKSKTAVVPLDSKFLSDTIARITDIENLETKHNADIAALQATIDALQAKIDALTNTAASSQ